jgi:hypothetical protein
MPKKISQIRIAFDDTYDVLHKLEYELIRHEGEFYLARRTIIYTPRDESFSKIRVI